MPSAPPPAATTEPTADARGVITYPDYQVVIAQPGDTLDSIATRIGVPVAGLASYNGLPSDWRPREGDTLVIPPEARVAPLATTPSAPSPSSPSSPAERSWSPELVAEAIERGDETPAPDDAPVDTPPPGAVAPLSVPQAAPDDPAPAPGDPPAEVVLAPGTETPELAAPVVEDTARVADPAPTEAVVPTPADTGSEPLRHTVAAGETIYSISRLYGVPVTAIAAWNGLGQDYTVRPGQTVLVPISVPPGQSVATAPPPPSADDPLPPNPPRAEIPASPELDRYRSDATETGQLLQPVPGQVIRPYQPSGPNRNDGIDIAADPGTPVLAADGGEVALISNSLGSLGKIVLIRHPSGLTTVYGRIDEVSVRKGDLVARGQVVGVVANTNPPSLHFEVRRGAQSVDPSTYF
ncbi:MAG: LysM peptidoglycan-binding domain-containing M23 family metallopeptidase [Pseudomonadota bacterium]